MMKRIASLLLLLAITLTLAAQNITVASITLDEKDLTFDVGVLKIAFPIRKICWTDKFFIPSHQQNPPRFSLDQRTRAGLLLYMSTIRRISGAIAIIFVPLSKLRSLNAEDNFNNTFSVKFFLTPPLWPRNSGDKDTSF